MSEYEKMILKYPPCKQLEQTCVEYDYDPCESSDDITEKDLAILLKEEARLREEREAAEAERLRREQELLRGKKSLNESGNIKNVKKCKKVVKNPFFNNRLEFSTCLPPPPPTPPPQFFPTFDEDEGKKCTGRRKKKCKKKKIDDHGSDKGLEDEFDEEEEGDEEGGEEEPEPEERPPEHYRRKCRKIYRPPCRKRSSEISNAFQPRQIPARQRDLPQTSPLEMPEVERQIWLSGKNDCQTNCIRNNCKMDCCKKKWDRKRQSSSNSSND